MERHSTTCVGVRMQHRQVIVLKNKGQWVIRSQKVANETAFETQDAALEAAVDVAHQLGKDGEPAKVMLCDIRSAQARVFWTYGEDPYPTTVHAAAPA